MIVNYESGKKMRLIMCGWKETDDRRNSKDSEGIMQHEKACVYAILYNPI